MPQEGQATEQPEFHGTEEDLARQAALRILDSEEKAPGGPTGEEKKPEPDKSQAQPEEKPEAKGEEKAEGEEEQKAPEQTEELRKHKLKVKAEDGSDVEIEVDDETLKAGFMMEKAFRAKTAQLAREREAVQVKIKEAVEPKVREYQERLQVFEKAIWQALAPEIQNVDWNKLAREDPATWAQKMQAVNNVNGLLQAVQQENARLAHEAREESQKKGRETAREAVETLQRKIPGWSQELYGKVLRTGIDYGFKPEEVNTITDPRALEVLHDAMKYRALQTAKPSVEKRVAIVPKVAKPGTAEKPDPSADAWKKGMARLKQSGGKTDDAVQLAKMLIKD